MNSAFAYTAFGNNRSISFKASIVSPTKPQQAAAQAVRWRRGSAGRDHTVRKSESQNTKPQKDLIGFSIDGINVEGLFFTQGATVTH